MTAISFYHLQRQPLERVLPRLLERSLERGWRVAVRFATPERLAALDDALWSYAEDSFLPHGTDRDGDPADHPVVLTLGGDLFGAQAAFLVEGAAVPPDLSGLSRLCYMLDGTDEAAVAQGRAVFRDLRTAGHDLSYWQQDEDGRWGKRA